MSKPTPLNEFKEIVSEHTEYGDLTDSQLETFRGIIDLQADMILESFITEKEAKENSGANE